MNNKYDFFGFVEDSYTNKAIAENMAILEKIDCVKDDDMQFYFTMGESELTPYADFNQERLNRWLKRLKNAMDCKSPERVALLIKYGINDGYRFDRYEKAIDAEAEEWEQIDKMLYPESEAES